MVERKGVPRKATARAERRGDSFKRASAVSPGRQVEKRTEGAVNEGGWLVEGKILHVALAQLEFNTGLRGAAAGVLEHRRRGIDADDAPAGRLRHRDRDPTVADGQF